jgi:hypothetical protein
MNFEYEPGPVQINMVEVHDVSTEKNIRLLIVGYDLDMHRLELSYF